MDQPDNAAAASTAFPEPQSQGQDAKDNGADAPSAQTRGHVIRSISTDIKEEGKELREAAEQSLNVILEISLEGVIRWASPGWRDVVGTSFEEVQGKHISEIVLDKKSVFDDAIKELRKDESGSKIVRFSAALGPHSLLKKKQLQQSPTGKTPVETTSEPDEQQDFVNLDAQGIIIHDRTTGEETHTMWMIRPAIQREITIDLPEILVDMLGVGAEILAQHLTKLAEQGTEDPNDQPPPDPVLCRICERNITPWWFPKHTELCLQEHRAEAELAQAHENLNDHRSNIVQVLDALESQSRQKTSSNSEPNSPTLPKPEYKGMTIGPQSSASSGNSSGISSPVLAPRERSLSRPNLSHHRARSFTVRRPIARIVELVLDLCDTALEINTPSIKEGQSGENGEVRTQSPQSEGRISQVLQWQSPSTSALENEAGLAALSDDTASLCRAKVDAIILYRRILEYYERIRSEFTDLVQECIDAALDKASRIAAGEDTGSSDESTSKAEESEEEKVEEYEEPEHPISVPHTGTVSSLASSPREERFSRSYDGPGALAQAFRQLSIASRSTSESPGRHMSVASTRSSSPKGCPTPRSISIAHEARAAALGEDTGHESDTSTRSTARSRKGTATDSPRSELEVPRQMSRDRKRTSLVLPSRGVSTNRQRSASRPSIPPLSPFTAMKAREPSISGTGPDGPKSPLTSPMLSSSEFAPTLPQPQTQSMQVQQQAMRHHRRQSSISFEFSRAAAMSPKLGPTSNAHSHPQPPRAAPPSIKDFDIIKPISKGAFGSVYLAKKKSTGDYYAIKALKKADMVAKNQVANVKAERAILMWQGESDFVAKLYWTFPSKDFIFLVSEYLNGGDCASLIRALGTLPEDWAKRYMAEVVLGVEHLHQREIVHRDLKPDNLLIDQKGHLKLTDFGLSRMGLIGRQKRALARQADSLSLVPSDPLRPGSFARSLSMASSRSTSFDYQGGQSPNSTPNLTPVYGTDANQPSYFNLSRDNSISSRDHPARQDSMHHNDIIDAEQLSNAFRRYSIFDESPPDGRASPKQHDEVAVKDPEEDYALRPMRSNSSVAPKPATPPAHVSKNMAPPPMALFDPDDSNRRFVGTPDYLAPETINGFGQDEMSDWWSLGCILFEFVFGYPPFHADTPDKVFEKILSRQIDWPSEDEDTGVSEEAKDLMSRLMTLDPAKRLGANAEDKYTSGGEEIRSHPWFADIDWETLLEAEASFVPAPENIEDTEYFDTRGAVHQDFTTEFDDQETSPAITPGGKDPQDRPHDALSRVRSQVNSMKRGLMPLHIPPHVRDGRSRRLSEPAAVDDFGQFSFKNLPILEKANKDVIQKLRAEAMQAQSRSNSQQSKQTEPTSATSSKGPPSLEGSPMIPMPLARALSTSKAGNPRSSSPSIHPVASPSRSSQPPSPLVQFSAGNHERRKTSSGSTQSMSAFQPSGFFDTPKIPQNTAKSLGASPVRQAKSPNAVEKVPSSPSQKSSESGSKSRSRSQTVGSNGSQPAQERTPRHHQKRMSQALDVSPSSSDNDDTRQKLLRVQKRRQSSRRMSQIAIGDGPVFRPLDVLVCEDHPVSRLVIDKLLEKLRCRTIVVNNGAEAMRYALGHVKFDLIMMEYKMPQVNGADVAKMIRETKNINCHTPIVCVTGYLKELQAPHNFDALVEKPPTMGKLTEVMSNLCQWRPPPPGWVPKTTTPAFPPQLGASFPLSSLRNESLTTEESPTSPSSGFPTSSGSFRTSRDDSISSVSAFSDASSSIRQQSTDWKITGLGISSTPPEIPPLKIPALKSEESAPADMEKYSAGVPTGSSLQSQWSNSSTSSSSAPRKRPSAEAIAAKRAAQASRSSGAGDAADDEDDDDSIISNQSLGPSILSSSLRRNLSQGKGRSYPAQQRHGSKLSTEMLRSDSQNSVISVINRDSSSDLASQERPSLRRSPPHSQGPQQPTNIASAYSRSPHHSNISSPPTHPSPLHHALMRSPDKDDEERAKNRSRDEDSLSLDTSAMTLPPPVLAANALLPSATTPTEKFTPSQLPPVKRNGSPKGLTGRQDATREGGEVFVMDTDGEESVPNAAEQMGFEGALNAKATTPETEAIPDVEKTPRAPQTRTMG